MFQIVKDYMNIICECSSFEIFSQVMDNCTENFVIHNNAKSNKLEDQVFIVLKAEQKKNGLPGFWKHHKDNYQQHYRSR